MTELKGAVAIVTGASKGFGREIALQLAAEGARVVAAARSEGPLRSLVEEIRASGGEAVWRAVELRRPEQCSELVRWTAAEMGALHILVNNAGLGHWAPLEDTTPEQWRETMEVNLDAPFQLIREAIPLMKRAGWGHVVNIASVLGRRPLSNMGPYCASKAALISLSEVLAREVRPHGIRVSVVSPGIGNTEFRSRHVGRALETQESETDRMLQPGDVASAVLWQLKSSRHVGYLELTLEARG